MKGEIAELTAEYIEDLVSRFLGKTLPIDDWTHEAHLITAIYHLDKFSQSEATHLLRCRIIEYNFAKGPGNSFASGYHETVTLLWIWLLDAYIRRYSEDVVSVTKRFLSSPLASGNWIFKFYSKELLASDQARARWHEPDLVPLDLAQIMPEP